MTGEEDGRRDLARLVVPRCGLLEATGDPFEPYRLVDADGVVVGPVAVSERVSNLYLVPTLYHDLVHHPAFATRDVSSVRKLGFAGAPMTDGLLQTLQAAFKPDLFVNHYGSSEIYTFTIDQNAPGKTWLGRPRRHQSNGARGPSRRQIGG